MNVRLRDTERMGLPMQTEFTTSPVFGDPRLPLRFWAKVRVGSIPAHRPDLGSCWEWTGALSGGTHYGCFFDGRPWSTHRYSWTNFYGAIPADFCVLHHCDNRPCVRPSHLWLGTKADNNHDMEIKGRARKRAMRGVANYRAGLTEEDVRRLRYLHDIQGISLSQLARTRGVSFTCVWRAVRRKSYREVL